MSALKLNELFKVCAYHVYNEIKFAAECLIGVMVYTNGLVVG